MGPRAEIDWKSFGQRFQLSDWPIGKASIKWLGASKAAQKEGSIYFDEELKSVSQGIHRGDTRFSAKKTDIVSIHKKITRPPNDTITVGRLILRKDIKPMSSISTPLHKIQVPNHKSEGIGGGLMAMDG